MAGRSKKDIENEALVYHGRGIVFTPNKIAEFRDDIENGVQWTLIAEKYGIAVTTVKDVAERMGISRRSSRLVHDYMTDFEPSDIKDIPTQEHAALHHLGVSDTMFNACINLWSEFNYEVKYARMTGDCRKLDPKRYGLKSFKELVDSTCTVIRLRKEIMEDLPNLDEQQNMEAKIEEMVKRRAKEGKKEFQRQETPPEGVCYTQEFKAPTGDTKKKLEEPIIDIEDLLKRDDDQLIY